MTVYMDGIQAAFSALQTAREEVDLGTATQIEIAALVSAGVALADATESALEELDEALPSGETGGFALFTEGADPEVCADLLASMLADFEQATQLHAILGYARRIVINLRQVEAIA